MVFLRRARGPARSPANNGCASKPVVEIVPDKAPDDGCRDIDATTVI